MVAVVSLFILLSWSVVPASTAPHYGIMFDAGSSHTAVSLFTWTNDMKNFSTLSWKKDVTPGISSFASNLDGLKEYLKPLVQFAASVVPRQSHSSTPIFIKGLFEFSYVLKQLLVSATAGLRLLDPTSREAILNVIRAYLSIPENNPFLFKPSWVQMISGQEEAVFGWITTNWLLGSFSDTDKRTACMLDLGGGSTQVAFEPNPEDLADPALDQSSLITISVFGQPRTLCAISFLGFGRDRAWLRLAHALTHMAAPLRSRLASVPENSLSTALLSTMSDAAFQDAVCPHKGAAACTWNANGHNLDSFKFSLVRDGDAEAHGEKLPHPCVPGHSRYSAVEGSSAWPLVGIANEAACAALIEASDLLNLTLPCQAAASDPRALGSPASMHCTIGGTYFPVFTGVARANDAATPPAHPAAAVQAILSAPPLPRGMPVIGCSAYYYSRKALGLPADVTASAVKQAAHHFCDASAEELAKELPKDKYREGHCFTAMYIYNLLTEAYGIPTDYPMRFEESIAGVELGWTLGAMIYEAHQNQPVVAPVISWVLISVAVAIAGGTTLLVWLRRRRLVRFASGSP